MYGKGRWLMGHGQVTGAMHLRGMTPCQDAIKYEQFEDGSIICVLADGHGSPACLYSQEGAKLATEIAVAMMEEIIENNQKQQIYPLLKQTGEVALPQEIERKWKEAVSRQHQKEKRAALEDKALYQLYGTTLMLLYITTSFVFALQIGDGDMLCVDMEGHVDYVIEATRTYGVETHSLCNSHCWRYAKTICQPIEAPIPKQLFLMSTDGYANSFITSEAFLETGKDYLNLLRETDMDCVEAMLPQWLEEATKVGSGDDITLALIYWEEEES